MGDYSSWVPTKSDRETAGTALNIQAASYGLDLNSHNVIDFIAHMSEVMASNAAEIRWLRNIINDSLTSRKE
jgi:hypothetical protein